MSAFEDHKEELEHFEKMMGANRGRLAVTLDLLTNAMVLVGQHGVYCHSHRDPGKPVMDIQLITQELRKAKELIQSVMEELRMEREARERPN
jgi:3-deoxy-D-manno-octulosonic acid (KDO) 8-phosphate synthase